MERIQEVHRAIRNITMLTVYEQRCGRLHLVSCNPICRYQYLSVKANLTLSFIKCYKLQDHRIIKVLGVNRKFTTVDEWLPYYQLNDFFNSSNPLHTLHRIITAVEVPHSFQVEAKWCPCGHRSRVGRHATDLVMKQLQLAYQFYLQK